MSYYGHGDDASSNTPSFHKSANPPSSQIDAAKIFVGGLSWQTTEETLRYHFEQYGEVVSVEVMRDRQTGDPRGFAFVVFKSDETVDLILKNSPHEINQKVVDVKRAQARGVAPPSIHHGGEVSLEFCAVAIADALFDVFDSTLILFQTHDVYRKKA